jgi:hypothetical protein
MQYVQASGCGLGDSSPVSMTRCPLLWACGGSNNLRRRLCFSPVQRVQSLHACPPTCFLLPACPLSDLFKWLWRDQLLLLGGKFDGAKAGKVSRLAENFRSELENVVRGCCHAMMLCVTALMLCGGAAAVACLRSELGKMWWVAAMLFRNFKTLNARCSMLY